MGRFRIQRPVIKYAILFSGSHDWPGARVHVLVGCDPGFLPILGALRPAVLQDLVHGARPAELVRFQDDAGDHRLESVLAAVEPELQLALAGAVQEEMPLDQLVFHAVLRVDVPWLRHSRAQERNDIVLELEHVHRHADHGLLQPDRHLLIRHPFHWKRPTLALDLLREPDNHQTLPPVGETHGNNRFAVISGRHCVHRVDPRQDAFLHAESVESLEALGHVVLRRVRFRFRHGLVHRRTIKRRPIVRSPFSRLEPASQPANMLVVLVFRRAQR